MVAVSAVGACVGAAAVDAGGAAEDGGLVPSDFAWWHAATASGTTTNAASKACRRIPMVRERIAGP